MKNHVILIMAGMVFVTSVIARAGGVGSPETQGQGKIAAEALNWSMK